MKKISLLLGILLSLYANLTLGQTSISTDNKTKIHATLDGPDAKILYDSLNIEPIPVAMGSFKKFKVCSGGYGGEYGSFYVGCSKDSSSTNYSCTINLEGTLDRLIIANGFYNFICENYPSHAQKAFNALFVDSNFLSSDSKFAAGCENKQCYFAIALDP